MKKREVDKSHIIPFPLPEYLADFLSSQLNTQLQIINDSIIVKAMHIKRRSSFGKMILRCLEKSDRPVFVKKGLTIYITVSKNMRIHSKKLVEARGTFLKLPDESIIEIQEVLEDYFKAVLVSYVDGAHFGHDYKKGKRDQAIHNFLSLYNMNSKKSSFERFKRMYYREKDKLAPSKQQINRML